MVAAFDREYHLGGCIRLLRNNDSSSGQSFGSDENYGVRTGIVHSALAEALLPHLVSRTIWAGAGVVNLDSRGNWTFELSARAKHMYDTIGSGHSPPHRAMIKMKNDYAAPATCVQRVQVTSGDTTMQDLALLLRMGSTAILLEMLESGRYTDWFTAMAIRSPLPTLNAVSHDIHWVAGKVGAYPSINLANSDATLSAIQVQRLLHAKASEHVEGSHPVCAEWRAVISLWDRALTACEGNLEDDPGLHRAEAAGRRALDGGHRLATRPPARRTRRGRAAGSPHRVVRRGACRAHRHGRVF